MASPTSIVNLLLRIILHPKTGVVIGSLGVILIIARELYKIFYSAQTFQERRAEAERARVLETMPEWDEKSAKAE